MGSIERKLAELESRISALEPKKKLSPREKSEAISQGDSDPHHIGKKSLEVLEQEAKSITQNFEAKNIASFSNKEQVELLSAVDDLFEDIKKTDAQELKNAWLGKLASIRDVLRS